MSLNPNTASYWNYTNENKDGYSLELTGTVVFIQEVQHVDYQTKTPSFYPSGDPKFDIRMGFATPEGELKLFQFAHAGLKKIAEGTPIAYVTLFSVSGGRMENLVGKTLHLWTWPANPETGQVWQIGNPRLFGADEVQDEKYELTYPLSEEYKVEKLLANSSAHGGQVMQQQPAMVGQFYAPPAQQFQQYMQPAQQYTVPQSPQQFPQPPQYNQYIPQPQQQRQPVMQQPMQVPQQMPTIQAMPPQQQPMTAPMPMGMDPVVAQAMQAVGATNVQPMAYEDIPF